MNTIELLLEWHNFITMKQLRSTVAQNSRPMTALLGGDKYVYIVQFHKTFFTLKQIHFYSCSKNRRHVNVWMV